MKNVARAGLTAAIVLAAVSQTWAQGKFSIAAFVGYAQNADKNDPYSLNSTWPSSTPTNTSSTENSLVFFSKADGISKSLALSYDATPHFGFSFIYRSINFTNNESRRSGTSNGLGVHLRLNLAKNTKKVIPFFEAEFMFSNMNSLEQEKATSPTKSGQVQPAYKASFTTYLGIGLDAGIEFKLSGHFGLSVKAGFHGFELAKDAKILGYPSSVIAPTNIDGTFFLMESAGIHYYFSSKKRDF